MRRNFGDINQYINKRFGDWLILGLGEDKLENNQTRRKTFRCKCLCGYCEGIEKDIITKNILSGRSKSCGVKSRIHNGKRNKKYNSFDLSNEYGIGYTLSGDKYLFDIEDFDKIKNICWGKHNEDGYLRGASNKRKNVFIHNIIMNKDKKDETVIDHINGDTFDNRKQNLRVCRAIDNMKNLKLYSNNKSGYKGVCWNKNEEKWKSYIYFECRKINLGTYEFLEDAVYIRKQAELKYFGEYNREEKFL